MNAPRSLRRLFENDDGPQPNSFKFPLKTDNPSASGPSDRSGSFGESSSTFSFPQSSSSSNLSVATPTASSFGAAITGKAANSEFNTIRLPTLDDDSDEEDALPPLSGSRYGSFGTATRADNMITMADNRPDARNPAMESVTKDKTAGVRKSHNLAQIVIPGIEDTVKFGTSGQSIEIDSGSVMAYETDSDNRMHGFNTGSGSQLGSGSDSGFTTGFGFNARWNANGSSSPTTIKFQPDRQTDPGLAFPETGFAFSPVSTRGSQRPGMRRAETENPADMQRPHQFPSSTSQSTISEAPDYAPNETFSFPSRPSSPFAQPQGTPSSTRLYHRSKSTHSQTSETSLASEMPVLPSVPVKIEPGQIRHMPPALPRMLSATSGTIMGKMSEPPIRTASKTELNSRPGIPRQASVAVMEGASSMSSLPGAPSMTSQFHGRNNRAQGSSSETQHRHRGSKASQGSGDSGRSYSLANNLDHAYPMRQSGQSSNGSDSISRDRSHSTSGMESDISSAAGGYEAPVLSPTLDLREALKVGSAIPLWGLGLMHRSCLFSHRDPLSIQVICYHPHLWDRRLQPSDTLHRYPRLLLPCRPSVPVPGPPYQRLTQCVVFLLRRPYPVMTALTQAGI